MKERKTKIKTTVRATIIPQDCYISIQRLYDCRTFFKLETEIKTDFDVVDFLENLIKAGGKIIEYHDFIDDDDFKEKTCAIYEYIA